jgi:hypothetical protein
MWHVKVGEKAEPSNFNRIEHLRIGYEYPQGVPWETEPLNSRHISQQGLHPIS